MWPKRLTLGQLGKLPFPVCVGIESSLWRVRGDPGQKESNESVPAFYCYLFFIFYAYVNWWRDLHICMSMTLYRLPLRRRWRPAPRSRNKRCWTCCGRPGWGGTRSCWLCCGSWWPSSTTATPATRPIWVSPFFWRSAWRPSPNCRPIWSWFSSWTNGADGSWPSAHSWAPPSSVWPLWPSPTVSDGRPFFKIQFLSRDWTELFFPRRSSRSDGRAGHHWPFLRQHHVQHRSAVRGWTDPHVRPCPGHCESSTFSFFSLWPSLIKSTGLINDSWPYISNVQAYVHIAGYVAAIVSPYIVDLVILKFEFQIWRENWLTFWNLK